MYTWYVVDAEDPATVQRLRAAWKDAPIENLEVLDMILDTAKAQVIAYAPELPSDDEYPSRYVLAQLMQARTLWAAGQVTSAGTVGEGEYVFTPRPMDKTVRTIIRPEDGKPDVG
ncbi:hypothetical protein SAMN04487848_2055 [Microbacterium sp. ru370.1]|uniref:hypothetical protein n=1 Tax=unclassified Microbacterium TaxID=2609290 RepID=UPI00088D5F1F|nr:MULTISPECIES: hypothetical protein [unclassified Microbacterium]SDO77650.1 hypothetical protein SAMN04487848_2055 [Microbacterium sp. ru370.1]SIT88921.1 hypothetical protein SAMN05880579_2050 [Microbacterium sp. RU1D]